MYTRPIYSPFTMLWWTHRETLAFIVIAAVPVLLYDVFGQGWLHLPWLPIALVGTAVAFILGFQNNAVYGRSWEARKIWGGITNSSRAFGLQLNDFITNEFTEEPATEEELYALRRSLVMRHVAWLTALRHALRQPRPWELFTQHPTNRAWTEHMQVREYKLTLEEELEGYLSESERTALEGKANQPAQIIALQSSELRKLHFRGLLDDFRHMEMARVLESLLEFQGKSERIKNSPYPRQYATLNTLYVSIFLLLIPFGLVHEFDSIADGLAAEYPRISEYFIWLSVPFSVIVMWIFHTMERVGRAGENPFEGSANDTPITTMSRGIEIDLRQMIGEPLDSIPAPIEPRHDTQT